MKTNTIITIGRQYGSAGRQIGRTLAEELGIKCYDKELLERAAKESGLCEELFENHDEKPTNSFLYSLVMDTYSFGYTSSAFSDMPINQKVFLAQFETIKKIASEGPCIMIGRCADYALADFDNCLSVFFHADLQTRIRRIAKIYDLTDAKAKDRIIKTDKKRSSYYNYYTSKRWGDADSYDLCIDSGKFGVDGSVELLLNAIQLKEKGYKTFICTGRAPFYAKRLFGDLVSGIISCNGRYILYEGKKLYSRAFTKKQLDYYVHKLDQGKLGAMFVSDDKALKYHLDQKQEVDLEKEYGIEHLVDSLEGDFYTFDMFYQSQEHYQTMVEIFKEDLIINDHGGMGSCDCSTIEFDKGSAIAYLLDYFHIDKDNAYAFGDGYNDQAMFREVGHGIAMGNAVDVLKEKATYITDNFDQEGILKALYHEKVLNEKDNY